MELHKCYFPVFTREIYFPRERTGASSLQWEDQVGEDLFYWINYRNLIYLNSEGIPKNESKIQRIYNNIMESLLISTKKLIEILKNHDTIDLSNLNFLQPIITLPLASLISEEKRSYKEPRKDDCRGYLDYFNFPDGYTKFKTLSPKYIPIYKFPVSKNNMDLIDKSGIIENLLRICVEKIGSPMGAVDTLGIVMEEIIDNIEEHSQAKYGWINAQYYPTKEYLDICILDRGLTLLKNYQNNGISISDDAEALKNALQGLSTKQTENMRGSGLRTFTRMVREALGGEMIIISGTAIAYANKDQVPDIQSLSVNWPGTIVAFRIPKRSEPVDYTKYID
jgi:anti-sigma regulatory factor (Ser/Thr protein kinase)